MTQASALTAGEVPAAVETLTAAFAAYPLFPWLCPNEAARPRAVEGFCRVLANYSLRNGVLHATPCRSAVACWLCPGHEWITPLAIIRAGLFPLFWRLGFRGSNRFMRLGATLDSRRQVHLGANPHWYLNLLGVRPEAQGKGLSRAVLAPVFEQADRDKLPCYLETLPEANVAIYRRLGFDLVGKCELPGGLPNREMVRQPR